MAHGDAGIPTTRSDDDKRSHYSQLDSIIYILDTGCFTDNELFFGVACGSELVIFAVLPIRIANSRNEKDGDGRPKGLKLDGWFRSGTFISPDGYVAEGIKSFIATLSTFSAKPSSSPNGLIQGGEIPNHPNIKGVFSPNEKNNYVVVEFFYANLEKEGGTDTANDLLTDPNSPIVFIPDTHIGIQDKCDNFARRPNADTKVVAAKFAGDADPHPARNSDLLRVILRSAKKSGATTVQTGDFLDIWEAESAPDIYLSDREVFIDEDWHSRRTRRARLAQAQIEAQSSFVSSLLDEIDHYIPGNHDAEYVANPYASAPGDKWYSEKTVGHWLFPKQPQLRSLRGMSRHGVESAWIAEHGHAYDVANDSSKAPDVGSMLPNVFGKQITYLYAAVERQGVDTGSMGELISTGLKLLAANTNKKQDPVFPTKTSILGRKVINVTHPVIGPPIADKIFDEFTTMLKKYFVQMSPQFYASWRNPKGTNIDAVTFNGAGTIEKSGFNSMRSRLFHGLVAKLNDFNKNDGFVFDGNFGGSFNFPEYGSSVNEFLVHYSSPNKGKRPKLPFRVLIHSHTHQPVLLRVILREKS